MTSKNQPILLNTSSLFVYKEKLKHQAALTIVPKKIVIKGIFEDKNTKRLNQQVKTFGGQVMEWFVYFWR